MTPSPRPEGSSRPHAGSSARRIVGTALIAVGGIWIAQGTGALGGSFMTGEGFWTLMGIVAALLGLALLVGAARQRRGTLDPD